MATLPPPPLLVGSKSSSVTLPTGLVIPDARLQHASSICDSASSTLGNGVAHCADSMGSSGWEADSTGALVSPVSLPGKSKKGGLLSGLKKMFTHKDGRAATGHNELLCKGDLQASGSTDGTAYLEALPPPRQLQSPGTLKLQTASSRDMTLAALLTSPVRGAPMAAPPSPATLNSPMPSMRDTSHHGQLFGPHVETDPSTGEVRLAYGGSIHGPRSGGGALSGGSLHGRPVGAGLMSQNPSEHGNSSLSPLAGQAGGPRTAGGAAAAGSQLASSMSSNLPAFKHQQLGGGALVKSHSSAAPGLSHAHSASPGLVRGDSAEDIVAQQAPSGHSSGVYKVALPYLATSARQLDSPPIASPGRMRTSSTAAMPTAEPEAPASEDEGEEEDEMPSTMLLGMNPAVPQAMRRRRWSLDDYQVVKRLYKGQTSAVYRAICQRSGMTVALKVYFLSRVPVNVVHMIRREIELHVPLVHRNIIALYGAFQDDKHIVLVQEYAARGDLFGIHRSMNCRLTETQTTELVLAPFLDALAYLHSRGIMHRDIKPENILFTQEWALKIADFGVSINLHEERAVTRTGTADYMAPEVERCPLKHAPEDNKDNPSLAYTTAIDVWSVGVLAYEMLVGFPPFVSNGQTTEEGGAGEAPRASVAAFMAEQATRKTLRFPASTSAAARDFIMATLAESPVDRPTAMQLLKHPWLFKLARRPSITPTRFSNTSGL